MHTLKNDIENKLKDTWGFKYGKLTNSGSEAIRFCLINAKIQKGTFVMMPVTICKSVVDEVVAYGCLPLFVDVDNDFCLDINRLEQEKVDKVSAIIYVHAYGILKDITELKSFCEKHNTILIEDSAQYICSYSRYSKATQGDFVIYSFGKGKPISVGAYGFLASNFYQLSFAPDLQNVQNLDLLYDKINKIDEIIKDKKKKVDIYKSQLNGDFILDKPSFLDNIYHRLLFYYPKNYYELSKKMYRFMRDFNLDNYQSTIPVEAFRDPFLQNLVPDKNKLKLQYFKNYKRLKKSYHYFRTCDWINKENILQICKAFNKYMSDEV